jgi:uncharacterized protein (TIGR03435 family)
MNPTRTRTLFCASVFAYFSITGTAQILHSDDPLPSFEAATIKAVLDAPPPRPGGPPPLAQDEVHMVVPVRFLIASAYNIEMFSKAQITGGPDWINSDLYDVYAKMSPSTVEHLQTLSKGERRKQVQLMEQSLLAERFRLKVRFVKKELPVFDLVLAKTGPKLSPTSNPPSRREEALHPVGQNWELKGNLSIHDLIGMLEMQPEIGGRLIEDRTGLTGTYELAAHWTQDRTGGIEATTDQYPPLFSALEQQLGLRLVESKEPLETLVIDHIERPSNN